MYEIAKHANNDMREIIIENMDDWALFCTLNGPALVEHYGSTHNAYQHAVQGGLTMGGGASPLTLIRFED